MEEVEACLGWYRHVLSARDSKSSAEAVYRSDNLAFIAVPVAHAGGGGTRPRHVQGAGSRGGGHGVRELCFMSPIYIDVHKIYSSYNWVYAYGSPNFCQHRIPKPHILHAS